MSTLASIKSCLFDGNHRGVKVLLALLMTLACSCEPLVTTFEEVEEAEYYQAHNIEVPPLPDTLHAMTWNIKYGGADIDFWWACYGDRILMTEDEVLHNLERLTTYINQVNPDILLLQEVAVNSKQAAYVNQMQYILDHTALNYGVYAPMWRVQYVPSDGLGRSDLGPAILSRWPLDEAQRIGLELRTDQDALTRYFYIRRCMVRVRLNHQDLDNFYMLTVHTAAWSQDDTKKLHIDRFVTELDAMVAEGSWFVAGGDLNTIPPSSQRMNDFPDAKCGGDFEGGDYSDEQAYLSELYGSNAYSAATPLEEYQQASDQSGYFTYGDKPDSLGFTRKLDYLFTNLSWAPDSWHTHQEIASGGSTLSDHAPVSAKIILSDFR
ncbi:endonuclease/exonuclease/phosphatase family protein [Candidatus Neomarinimicrobiota bacterium]